MSFLPCLPFRVLSLARVRPIGKGCPGPIRRHALTNTRLPSSAWRRRWSCTDRNEACRSTGRRLCRSLKGLAEDRGDKVQESSCARGRFR